MHLGCGAYRARDLGGKRPLTHLARIFIRRTPRNTGPGLDRPRRRFRYHNWALLPEDNLFWCSHRGYLIGVVNLAARSSTLATLDGVAADRYCYRFCADE